MARISYLSPEKSPTPSASGWKILSRRPPRPRKSSYPRASARRNALLHDDVFKQGKGTAEWDLKDLLRANIAISMSCSY
jgi:hypothetical protein